ncbi:MAG: NUDIX hydrolase N-terminal domain-containing protein [Bacilli bacterium]|jgi:8-oxo-dGTP diphosphatase|nr:NUDIX hydrolase N-terminal domain-containing protein [Bacilli bacterium]
MKYLEYLIKMQGIAKIGLTFSTDPYALDNYLEIQYLTKKMLEQYTNTALENDNYFIKDIYPTPSVSARVMIIENNKILLVREVVDHKYALPGGWCDLYDSPQETAIKEVLQESGYDVRIKRVLGIFDHNKHQDKATSICEYSIIFEGEIIGGKPETAYETDEVNFYDLNELPPFSWKISQEEYQIALDVLLNNKDTYFE